MPADNMINFWCGKCRQDIVLHDKQEWALTKHLLSQCVEHLREVSKKYRQGRPWPTDDPPEWIICPKEA